MPSTVTKIESSVFSGCSGNGYDTSVWYNGRAVRYIFGRMPTVWYSIQQSQIGGRKIDGHLN